MSRKVVAINALESVLIHDLMSERDTATAKLSVAVQMICARNAITKPVVFVGADSETVSLDVEDGAVGQIGANGPLAPDPENPGISAAGKEETAPRATLDGKTEGLEGAGVAEKSKTGQFGVLAGDMAEIHEHATGG